MVRSTQYDTWSVLSGRTWERYFLRGSAKSATVHAYNIGAGSANLYVRAMNYVGGLYDSHVLMLNPSYFIPMHDLLYPNLGSAGGNAVLAGGALVNTNPIGDIENNVTFRQVVNGFIRLNTAGSFSSYNGPFAIEMWVKPTLISSIAVLYQEANNAFTHYMQVLLGTDRRISFTMSNAVTTFNVKDAAGPQLNMNAWNHLVFNYSTPNFTAYVNGVATAAVSVGAGLAIFGDSAATYIGFANGTANGWIAAPALYNQPTVGIQGVNGLVQASPLLPMAIDQHLYDMIYTAYTVDLDTSAMVAAASFRAKYGEGAAQGLPAVLVVGFNVGSGDAFGYVTVTLED